MALMVKKRNVIRTDPKLTGLLLLGSATRLPKLILGPMVTKRSLITKDRNSTDLVLLGSADPILARNIDHVETIQKVFILPLLSELQSLRDRKVTDMSNRKNFTFGLVDTRALRKSYAMAFSGKSYDAKTPISVTTASTASVDITLMFIQVFHLDIGKIPEIDEWTPVDGDRKSVV